MLLTTRVHNKKKPFTVYAGRPGPWGNPYSHKPGTLAKYLVASREEAVAEHRAYISARPSLIEKAKRELKGEVLGCWCNDDQACHCDNWIDAAEGRLDVVDDSGSGGGSEGVRRHHPKTHQGRTA